MARMAAKTSETELPRMIWSRRPSPGPGYVGDRAENRPQEDELRRRGPVGIVIAARHETARRTRCRRRGSATAAIEDQIVDDGQHDQRIDRQDHLLDAAGIVVKRAPGSRRSCRKSMSSRSSGDDRARGIVAGSLVLSASCQQLKQHSYVQSRLSSARVAVWLLCCLKICHLLCRWQSSRRSSRDNACSSRLVPGLDRIF